MRRAAHRGREPLAISKALNFGTVLDSLRIMSDEQQFIGIERSLEGVQ